MASGTIYGTTSNEFIDMKLEWETVPYVSTNESNLTLALYYRRNNTGYTTYGTGQFWVEYSGITHHSEAKTWTISTSWVRVLYTTQKYLHNADGTHPSITISAGGSIPGTSLASSRLSGTIRFDTIPRATTIDSLKCNTSYVDGIITALYTPKNSAFYTQRIVYVNVNNKLTQIHAEKLGQSATIQQTLALKFNDTELSTIYSKVTNTANATIRVTLQTYSDSGYSTKVGGDQYLEISLALPESITPKAELTITQVNSNAWLASKKIYATGLSGVTAVLSAESGEGIDAEPSTSIVYNGVAYATAQHDVATLKTAGNIEITGKATDSRGRTATDSKSITVLPYSSPVITSMAVERGTYDNGWTEAEDGPDVRVVFKTTLSLTDYDNVYAAAFEIDNESETPSHSTTSGLTSGEEHVAYFIGLNGDTSHTLKLTTTDSVGNVGTAKLVIPTIYVTMDFHFSGKGIAMGKPAEAEELLDVAWQIKTGKPAETLQGFSYRGMNPEITTETDDAYAWASRGNLATMLFTKESTLPNKPTDYGFLFNVTNGGAEVHQIWLEQPGGTMLHRGANSAGFTVWKKILDDSNCADYVVEQGTSGIWTYRKWKSGIAECWGVRTLENVKVDQKWGSLYFMTIPDTIDYPFKFVGAPTETAVIKSDDVDGWTGTSDGNTTEKTGKYYLMRPDSTSVWEHTAYIHYNVKGRWK